MANIRGFFVCPGGGLLVGVGDDVGDGESVGQVPGRQLGGPCVGGALVVGGAGGAEVVGGADGVLLGCLVGFGECVVRVGDGGGVYGVCPVSGASPST